MKPANIILAAFLTIAQICWCNPVPTQEGETFSVTMETLRDPFIPPSTFMKAGPELSEVLEHIAQKISVRGVIIDRNQKYVIINEDIVKENETWDEFTILKITRNSLTIKFRNETVEYPIAVAPEQE